MVTALRTSETFVRTVPAYTAIVAAFMTVMITTEATAAGTPPPMMTDTTPSVFRLPLAGVVVTILVLNYNPRISPHLMVRMSNSSSPVACPSPLSMVNVGFSRLFPVPTRALPRTGCSLCLPTGATTCPLFRGGRTSSVMGLGRTSVAVRRKPSSALLTLRRKLWNDTFGIKNKCTKGPNLGSRNYTLCVKYGKGWHVRPPGY